MAERTAITNEPVGAGIGRALRGMFSGIPGRREVDEAARMGLSVPALRRARAQRMESPDENATVGRDRPEIVPDMVIPVTAEAPRNEVAAAAAARRPATRRPAARMSPRESMSADDLNALSLARGEGEGEAAANIRRRLSEMQPEGMKKGGKVKKMAYGGPVKAPKKMASGGMTRGDGCASKGKTRGRMV